VNGDPQGAGEGEENAQQVEPVQGQRRLRVGGKVHGEAGNPALIFQQHDRADRGRAKAGEKIRLPAAEIHARNDHVEKEVDEERVARQVGEVEQEGQGDEVEGDLEEDLVIDVPVAGGG